MSWNQPYEVLYQNQMQFNLGVPLAASNMASHYQKPCPVMVERLGGQNAVPGRLIIKARAPENVNVSATSSFNYSMLSEDTMTKVSQMAKRDLKNRRLQMQTRDKSPSAESINTKYQRHQPKMCTRQRRPLNNRPRAPLRAKESEKNRRVGNVQTPPARKPRPSNASGVEESLYSHDNSAGDGSKDKDVFFPVKNVAKSNTMAVGAKDELGKLHDEMENYLQMLCRIERQVLRDGNTDFLQQQVKGKVKDNFLEDEEDLNRVRVRAGEHNTRSARNLYNLCQKVKQLQREVSHADLSKPTKKSQIVAQLSATYRGAVRALQTFVNQLPYQDLHMGLPSTYNELALLLRQLTTLITLTQRGSNEEGSDNVLSLLDQVDDFNSKWCSMALQSNKAAPLFHKKAWVSDAKVDSDLLSRNPPPSHLMLRKPPPKKGSSVGRPMSNQQQRLKERKSKAGRGGGNVGKENKMVRMTEGSKAASKSSKSLAGQKFFGFVPVESKQDHSNRAIIKDIDSTKGYMLPSELIAKRERAQRAVELSNNKNFAEATVSSRLKSTSPTRPSSAPSPARKKEVNFDLSFRDDRKSPLPWIPAGCASFKPRPRSSSAERSPFLVRALDSEDMRDLIPDRYSRSASGQDGVERGSMFGYRSLPSERQLRSCDVSDSFLDLIEKRILYRMMEKRTDGGRGRQSRKDQMYYARDEALDITDLTVDRSTDCDPESLNTTAEAAAMVDAPTLENIGLKLADMERTRREIRQRWSTLKFMDTRPKSSHVPNDCPEEPKAFDIPGSTITKTSKERDHTYKRSSQHVIKEWCDEPLIFTKPRSKKDSLHQQLLSAANVPPTTNIPGRQQISVTRQTLDRILENRDRLEDHMRKRSHHPTGKFDPWSLVEEISEEILSECLQEVSEEVEKVSEEMANQMYKSEFMVTGRPSELSLLNRSPEMNQGQVQDSSRGHSVFITQPLSKVDEGGKMSTSVEDGHAGDGMFSKFNLHGLEEDYGTGREIFADNDEIYFKNGDVGFDEDSQREEELESPHYGVASEPFLDNVSQLVQEKVEGLVTANADNDGKNEKRVDEGQDRAGRDDDNDEDNYGEDYEDKYDDDEEEDEKEDEDDDDDDGDYSDDEFENVSDVEL